VKHSNPLAGLFLTLFLALSLVACGGTSNPPPPNPTDKTAPTLTSSLPGAGANAVPINAKLAFSFSEAMSESSLELTSNPAITLGTAIWNESSTSVAFENENLAASTAYTLTLKAKDTSGNALAPTTLTFTTSDKADTTAPSTPTGLVATPANGQVTLTWQANSESDVVGYTLYVGTAQDKLESKEFVTTNSTTVTGLTNGTTYFFAVDAVDAANNHSGQTASVSATPSATVTDTTAPTLQSSDPKDGATGVNPDNLSIKLVFSEPMDTASFSLTLPPPNPIPKLLDLEPAATKPFNVSWSEADTVATLTLEPPNELLFEETTFTLVLSAKDKAGNALSGDNEIVFTTGKGALRLLSSDPANGATDIPAGTKDIELRFSQPVKNGTLEITGNFPYDCPIFESISLTHTFTVKCELYDGNTYTLNYEGQDLDLHAFSGSISFSTVPDTVAPSVLVISPNDLAVDVPLATPIEIWFDDEMDEASTLAAVSSSPDVGCTWSLSEEKDKLVCSPANLQADITYELTVSTDAKDTSGHAIAAPFIFRFSTIKAIGSLQVNISDLPVDQKRVRVTGPDGFDSGLLDSSTPFPSLPGGDYTVTASAFTLAPGKPACRIYTPTPASQTVTVRASQTTTATVTYESESCALPF
jgi:Bacterial Ig-like domain/Fibronectin type III domain